MECLIEGKPCSCTEAELLQGVFPEGCHNSLCCLCTLSQHPLNGERASCKDGRKNFSKVLRCGVHMGFLFFPLMSKTMFRIEQEKILRSCSFSMNPLLRKNTKISKLFIFCSSAEKRSTTQNLSEKVSWEERKKSEKLVLVFRHFPGTGNFYVQKFLSFSFQCYFHTWWLHTFVLYWGSLWSFTEVCSCLKPGRDWGELSASHSELIPSCCTLCSLQVFPMFTFSVLSCTFSVQKLLDFPVCPGFLEVWWAWSLLWCLMQDWS